MAGHLRTLPSFAKPPFLCVMSKSSMGGHAEQSCPPAVPRSGAAAFIPGSCLGRLSPRRLAWAISSSPNLSRTLFLKPVPPPGTPNSLFSGPHGLPASKSTVCSHRTWHLPSVVSLSPGPTLCGPTSQLPHSPSRDSAGLRTGNTFHVLRAPRVKSPGSPSTQRPD